MGLAFSSLMRLLAANKTNLRILMVGLDAAGKTTILYNLKLGEVTSTIPTIGFNVETVEYKNLRMTVWDVGGQKRIRHLWYHYFTGTAAVIFVIDSSDIDRLDEAAEELHLMMQRFELQNAVLLVFANKQDLPNAMSVTKMAQDLKLNDLKQPWNIMPVCATKGNGLWEGLDNLSEMLNKHKVRT